MPTHNESLRRVVISVISVPMILIGLCSSVTWAQPLQVNGTCAIVHRGENALAEDVAILLKKRNDTFASVCIDKDGKIINYASIAGPRKQVLNVCSYQVSPPFIPQVPNRPESSPEVFMLATRGVCPPAGNENYVHANGVSEGLFLALSGFAENISASASEFDRSVAEHSNDPGSNHVALEKFRREILTKKLGTRLRLVGVSLADQADKQGYELLLKDESSEESWLFTVDLMLGNLKVFDVQCLSKRRE